MKSIVIKKVIIGILATLVVSALGFGGYTVLKANQSLNKITGKNDSVFKTIGTLLPQSGSAKDLQDDNGRINILVLGMRGADDSHGGLLSDSNIILSIDKKTNRAALISIPRDTYVEVPGFPGKRKLNEAHLLGQERGKKGLETAMATISKLTDVPIQYGFSVDFEAFQDIITQLGGVDVKVANDFADSHYGGISVRKGVVHMDSKRALQYVQSRLSTNDFDRSRRQREVILAIKEKMKSSGALKNPLFLLNLLDSLGKHAKTTMSADQLKAMLELSNSIDLTNIIEKGFDTSPNSPLTSSSNEVGQYIIIPKGGSYKELQRQVKEIFNTASKPVTNSNTKN